MPQASGFAGNNNNAPPDPVGGRLASAAEVEKFHTNADTDGDEGSIHHTLGPGKGQAAGGDHSHDGGSSKLLGVGFTITGSKSANAAVASIMTFLVDKFGVTDNTT